VNSSVIGRLLEEISWEGASVRAYRDGGRGRENVLTAEVLLPLSFLPRTSFLGEVIRTAHGADDARARVVREIEDAEVTLLPDELVLPGGIKVQPDAQIVTNDCLVLLEAKRIRRSSFQTEQLAREYVALLAAAGSRVPLLLLVLGNAPPVTVQGHGRLEVADAIALKLANVLERTSESSESLEPLVARIPDIVAWVTWDEVGQAVAAKQASFSDLGSELSGTLRRLSDAVTTAIDWHS